jgi:hypothetical protein
MPLDDNRVLKRKGTEVTNPLESVQKWFIGWDTEGFPHLWLAG